MRKLVRIDIGFDERGCLFPNGIVQDMKTTPRRISAGIELSSPEKGPVGPHSCGSAAAAFGSMIGVLVLNFLSGQSGQLILVPHGLIVERKMRRTMRHRNSEKIRMLERPDLRIERVTHHVQPGLPISVLSQTCLGAGLYESTSVNAS